MVNEYKRQLKPLYFGIIFPGLNHVLILQAPTTCLGNKVQKINLNLEKCC